jgi:aryl-alcohol dehydrogenase-like predicted oxidoreductase
MDGRPDGWGEVDDDESVAAVRRAVELGVSFFDTADVYGAGHSEEVLGRVLPGRRDEVVIATKSTCTSCTWGSFRPCRRRRSSAPLEELVAGGLIRAYGWSTGDPQRAAEFAGGAHCAAIQHPLNVLAGAPDLLAVCDVHGLASVSNSPLAMGLLTGKYGPASQLPPDDVRAAQPCVGSFTGGRPAPAWLARLDAVCEVLTSGGRTLAQGVLGWLLARSPRTIPIPGIRTVAQAGQNAAVLRLGPLPAAEMAETARLHDRSAVQSA